MRWFTMRRLRLWAALLLPLAAGCKYRPRHVVVDNADASGYAGEGASDGKKMVKGCIWYYAAKGENRDDTLAFCDDGRICVEDNGWKCIQFVTK